MTGNNPHKKFLIVHGHFYQPPRENPWLDLIEPQNSAHPYHDWNERIYDECYRPNAHSRLLDANGMITDIHNNYETMSFNFGPTLFSWLEQHHKVTAQRIIDADKKSAAAMNGHGNSIAQVYNHIIMPLASRKDQLTQLRWTKQFFRSRFGRDPEGIWLAETAINMDTVTCLIEEDFKFVVLSPNQAESFRPIDHTSHWTHTSHHPVDTRRTYRIFPTDKEGNRTADEYLDVFFFDEGLSKEVSFMDLLKDAHTLGNRINSCYNGSFPNQVVTIATDGETFGHHKAFGDMCLAYFYKKLAAKLEITPVNFGYYLELNPPQFEVTLKDAHGEGTAWSCAHGVGRWARDCGCSTGGEPHWKQTWREPLRKALNNLQKHVDNYYVGTMSKIVGNPWMIRDHYIKREKGSWTDVKALLETDIIAEEISKEQVFSCMRLLEAQKYMLFSFTSCGWFFSEISGIEAMKNLEYACRALQLGIPADLQKSTLESFLSDLERIPSNLKDTNGRKLFEKNILPFYHHDKVLSFTAAVQRAINIKTDNHFDLFGFSVTIEPVLQQKPGVITYDGYIVKMENGQTGEEFSCQVLISHRDYAEVTGWVLPFVDPGKLHRNIPRPDAWMSHPEAKQYTLKDLFDVSSQELECFILEKIAHDTDIKFTAWMKKNELELDFLSRLNIPIPGYCTAPMSYVFQEEWKRACKKMKHPGDEESAYAELLELSRTARQFEININTEQSVKILEDMLVSEISNLASDLTTERCNRIRYMLNIVDRFKISVSKSRLEDMFHPILYNNVAHLYDEISKSSRKDEASLHSSRREVLIQLISFARRMNFNTDAFQIN